MPENFISIQTVVLNNWEVRISLYEISESFRSTIHLSKTSRDGYGIEEELINAFSEESK
jgi:hypothetical protein